MKAYKITRHRQASAHLMRPLFNLLKAMSPPPLTKAEESMVREVIQGVRAGRIDEASRLPPRERRGLSLALRRGHLRDGGFWAAHPGYVVTPKGEKLEASR